MPNTADKPDNPFQGHTAQPKKVRNRQQGRMQGPTPKYDDQQVTTPYRGHSTHRRRIGPYRIEICVAPCECAMPQIKHA